MGLMDITLTYPCFYRHQFSKYQNLYVRYIYILKYWYIGNKKMHGFDLCSF